MSLCWARSTDIVESNVRRTLYEIEHQQPYTTTHTQTQTQSEQRELGVVITELPDLQEVPSCETQVLYMAALAFISC